MVPPCSDRISRVPPYSIHKFRLRIRGCHPLWPNFPECSADYACLIGLVRVRSPLLTESRLMSFPPVTEMFQFAGFASPKLYIHFGDILSTSFRARPFQRNDRERKEMVRMGFPIRKSADQRLLTPPRSLSQRATSFIACVCQGIHQMLLPHT